jgi:hypothetical protein
MFKIEASHEFDAPAEAVWDFLQDFGHIERWWPQDAQSIKIERIELEGKGVGMVRHVYNAFMTSPVSERLDALDPDNKTLQIAIIGDRPAGLTFYQAYGKVVDLPGQRCRLDYAGEFTTESGQPEDARAFLAEAYRLMFVGLTGALARSV